MQLFGCSGAPLMNCPGVMDQRARFRTAAAHGAAARAKASRIGNCIVAVGLLSAAPGLSAQQPTRATVSSEQACESCRVDIVKDVTLGSEDDSLVADVWNNVVRTESGDYVAANLIGPRADHLRLYSSDGEFVRRIGRRGRGPGEFGSILHMTLGRADSIFVFEPGRVSVMSPAANFVRTINIPITNMAQAIVTPENEFLVSAQYRTRELAGLPVHRLSSSGQHLASFGAEPPAFDLERPSLSVRRIARAQDGSLWLVRPDRYEIEHWTADGRRLRVLTRTVDWFPPREVEMYGEGERPTPFIRDIRVGPEGNLWVLAIREDPDWRRSSEMAGYEQPASPARDAKLFDSVVEVIDPASASLVASLQLPYRAGRFVNAAREDGSMRIWALHETDLGLFMIDVWRLSLNQ